MACRTGCITKSHASWGECARDAHFGLGSDVFASRQNSMTQKAWDKELRAFDDAVAQGIHPDGTKLRQVRKAVDVSNKHGAAYDGHGVEHFETVQTHRAEVRDVLKELPV